MFRRYPRLFYHLYRVASLQCNHEEKGCQFDLVKLPFVSSLLKDSDIAPYELNCANVYLVKFCFPGSLSVQLCSIRKKETPTKNYIVCA